VAAQAGREGPRNELRLISRDELPTNSPLVFPEHLDPEYMLVLADRCLEADYQIHRRVYLPLVLDALTCDLVRLVNPRAWAGVPRDHGQMVGSAALHPIESNLGDSG
jgi:hypothetical protein